CARRAATSFAARIAARHDAQVAAHGRSALRARSGSRVPRYVAGVVRRAFSGETHIATRNPGGWRPIVVLVLCVAAFNYAWMPADFIAGDPTGWREETRSLLLRC